MIVVIFARHAGLANSAEVPDTQPLPPLARVEMAEAGGEGQKTIDKLYVPVDLDSLGRYMAQHVPGYKGPINAKQFSKGLSNPKWVSLLRNLESKTMRRWRALVCSMGRLGGRLHVSSSSSARAGSLTSARC